MDMIAALTGIVGTANLRIGEDIPARNRADAAEIPALLPLALVMPTTTEQVSQVLALCHREGQKLVIQGGMTGLAGAAHPQAGEVALSLERMTGIEDVDAASRTMIVRAGTPLYQVQAAAHAAGLHYGVDLGARGTCTIGGNVATNAGGVQALRYGITRKNVLGLEAVLPDGTVLNGLNRMMKNNTGYDWPQLLIGSEGTLAVITRVSLALVPRPAEAQTALCAVDNVEAAIAILAELERQFPGRLLTFEGMWREYMEVTARLATLPEPFAERPEITLLIEVALGDDADGQDRLAEVLAGLMEQGLINDALMAQSLQERERFWAYREANYEFERVTGSGTHFDISLPINRMTAAIDHLRKGVASQMPGHVLVTFGHLGDSNLHLAIFPPKPGEDTSAGKAIVYDMVGQFTGSISAEHGIGVLKRPYLSRSRSPAELALMRSLKQTFDPHGILNRDRIFTLQG